MTAEANQIPDVGIPPDLVREDVVVGMSAETWHLPRNVWRPIRAKYTGRGSKVLVLDTGFASHPAIDDPIKTRSFIRGESVDDRNGHGTHCAGTICANDEDIGVAPDADLYVGKVLSNRGSGSSSGIAAGIRWGIELGVDVISMSLGGGSAYQPTIDAVRDAMAKGIWVVIAAGNSGFNGRNNSINWPAKSGEGVTTAALKADGTTASFSSGGSQMTWACPGQQILSLDNDGAGFRFMSGTSMATPFGAGVACLAIQMVRSSGRPTITGRDAIKTVIKANCDDLAQPGHDPSTGHGVPNVLSLISKLSADELEWI